jgi:hypothetical protein
MAREEFSATTPKGLAAFHEQFMELEDRLEQVRATQAALKKALDDVEDKGVLSDYIKVRDAEGRGVFAIGTEFKKQASKVETETGVADFKQLFSLICSTIKNNAAAAVIPALKSNNQFMEKHRKTDKLAGETNSDAIKLANKLKLAFIGAIQCYDEANMTLYNLKKLIREREEQLNKLIEEENELTNQLSQDNGPVIVGRL